MFRKLLVGIALAALAAAPLFAAGGDSKESEPSGTTHASRTGWGFRVGYLRGDDVGRRPLGYTDPNDELFDRPKLKSTGVVGGFWYYTFPHYRFEVRGSIAPSKIEHACPDVDYFSTDRSKQSCRQQEGSVSVQVYYFDLVLVPHLALGSERFRLGFPFGVGWAIARSPKAYAPSTEILSKGGDRDFSSGAGMTYFVGLRPVLDLNQHMSAFFEIRALRFHRLVNIDARTAKTVEATVGMSFAVGGGKKKTSKEAPPPAQPAKP